MILDYRTWASEGRGSYKRHLLKRSNLGKKKKALKMGNILMLTTLPEVLFKWPFLEGLKNKYQLSLWWLHLSPFWYSCREFCILIEHYHYKLVEYGEWEFPIHYLPLKNVIKTLLFFPLVLCSFVFVSLKTGFYCVEHSLAVTMD